MKREMNVEAIEKRLNVTICPKCNYYNNNKFAKRYGRCNRCHAVIDEKTNFEYTMIKKLHLYRKGQAGFRYRKDVYEGKM